METIKTFICDDSQDIIDGYMAYIELSDNFEYVGSALTSAECISKIKNAHADVILLDIQMEDEYSGINLITQIKELCPQIKIIMLTSYENSNYIALSISAGATGYVIKQSDGFAMLDEIKSILAGNVQSFVFDAFKTEVKNLNLQRASLLYMMNNMVKLSPAEYEILQDIYKGMTYKKIAKKRFVEECTINTTASRIIKKFEMGSMKELISVLRSMKIFDEGNFSLNKDNDNKEE
jgi:DNA-binding NarL/FixJ family response regulator